MKTRRVAIGTGLLLALLLVPLSASAQIEDNLSSYTGDNGVGYMEPLKDAIGTALNDGLFMSANIPKEGFRVRLSVHAMVVQFSDEDRTFMGTPEDYFPGQDPVEIPTIVGGESAVTVTDPGSGAMFSFPGGFNLDNFGLAVPQLTIGSVAGTEAIIRWFAVETGDAELGDVSFFGLGARHSLSQYLEDFPVHLAAMFMWQSLEIGSNLLDATGTSFGVQASQMYSIVEPYAGFSIDSFDMNVKYDTNVSGQDETIELDFDRKTTAHLTLGAALHLKLVHLHGEFNAASQTSWAFGLGLGL